MKTLYIENCLESVKTIDMIIKSSTWIIKKGVLTCWNIPTKILES